MSENNNLLIRYGTLPAWPVKTSCSFMNDPDLPSNPPTLFSAHRVFKLFWLIFHLIFHVLLIIDWYLLSYLNVFLDFIDLILSLILLILYWFYSSHFCVLIFLDRMQFQYITMQQEMKNVMKYKKVWMMKLQKMIMDGIIYFVQNFLCLKKWMEWMVRFNLLFFQIYLSMRNILLFIYHLILSIILSTILSTHSSTNHLTIQFINFIHFK